MTHSDVLGEGAFEGFELRTEDVPSARQDAPDGIFELAGKRRLERLQVVEGNRRHRRRLSSLPGAPRIR
jgi:hypothetical protein